MGFFEFHMHYMANSTVDLDGDAATAVTYLYNPCVLKDGDGTVLTRAAATTTRSGGPPTAGASPPAARSPSGTAGPPAGGRDNARFDRRHDDRERPPTADRG